MQVKTKIRWLFALFVVGAVIVAHQALSLAAEPAEIRRLALENQVAGLISELKLTAAQKAELKEIVDRYRELISQTRAELAELLAKRRDALLAGDPEGVDEANQALRGLLARNPWASDEAAKEFVSGLTERQKGLLERVLPGIRRAGVKADESGAGQRISRQTHVRRDGPDTRPPSVRNLPPRRVERFHRWTPGHGLSTRAVAGTEFLDIFSEFLGR